MMAIRPSASLAVLALAALATGGCVAVSEAITGREVTCVDTPDADCIRLIEFTLAKLEGDVNDPDIGPITRIVVSPMDCQFLEEPAATRCWEVEIVNAGGGAGAQVYERADGTLAAG